MSRTRGTAPSWTSSSVELLTAEVHAKVAAAVAGIPEASVTVVSEHGDVKATVAIPWLAAAATKPKPFKGDAEAQLEEGFER